MGGERSRSGIGGRAKREESGRKGEGGEGKELYSSNHFRTDDGPREGKRRVCLFVCWIFNGSSAQFRLIKGQTDRKYCLLIHRTQ
jgi:hypothetical protein